MMERILSERLVVMASLLFFVVIGSGCATYQSKVSEARVLMEQGKSAEAVERLKPLAEKADGDQLVYLLDYGMALQASGNLKESNRVLISADRLSEEQDYHSVSRVTGSLLLNEEMKQYKGDTFEKIFINAQLALNFLQMGQNDEALVECRRINEKFLKLRAEESRELSLNPFSKYLSAVIWEANHKYDDAAIAYEEAYNIDPNIEGIREDLIRSSKLARRDVAFKKWKQKFSEVQDRSDWTDRSLGELIVVVQQGWGPRKIFSRSDARWPELEPVFSKTQKVLLDVDGEKKQSRVIYNVSRAAMRTLEEDRLSLVGRRIGGIIAKDLAAEEIRKKNELLGLVAWFAFHASDRADLRQWSTLPETVQIIRVFLKPGHKKIRLVGLDSSGSPTDDHLDEQAVEVRAGGKTFLVWRVLR